MTKKNSQQITITGSLANTHNVTQSSLVDAHALYNNINTLINKGLFKKALAQATIAHQKYPEEITFLGKMLSCQIVLSQWEDAISYANKYLEQKEDGLVALHALAHAYHRTGKLGFSKVFGNLALNQLDSSIKHISPPTFSQANGKKLPLPSSKTKHKNVIAFSLYGDNPRYCETAILNVEAQPSIYPNWVCRFYIDASVPKNIQQRLENAGAELVNMQDSKDHALMGTMWRFLALADKSLHRVIFRDADSLISKDEANAVQAWVETDRNFHLMRDGGSHTELILAGMWGAVVGKHFPIQDIAKKMHTFKKSYTKTPRFTDQAFLRETLWAYVRHSVLIHDSVFGFYNAQPYPNRPQPKHKIGSNIANQPLVIDIKLPQTNSNPQEMLLDWCIIDKSNQKTYCEYKNTKTINNQLYIFLPNKVLNMLKSTHTLKILNINIQTQ